MIISVLILYVFNILLICESFFLYLGGMYDETQELLATQNNNNNYFNVDVSSSFGKPVGLAQDRSQTK